MIRLVFRLIKLAAVLLVLGAAAWFFRTPLLRSAAHAWVVHEPLAQADGILVLGGGRDWRPFAAANLYLNGQAPRVLVLQPEATPSQSFLQQPTEAEISLAILAKKGVPAEAIERLAPAVTSTREEALALRDWALQNQAKHIVIPTDPFHTRRVRWIFDRALVGTSTEVHVIATPHPRYTEENWWQDEEGFLTFQNELVKSLYYLANYSF
jgi:uncharacterized SAM-binding protein YcdF (DUF218 family)